MVYIKSKKCLSGIVATSLIIILAVLSTISFQSWFGNFQSGVFNDAEIIQSNKINLEGVYGDTIFLESFSGDNIDLIKIQNSLGVEVCSLSKNTINNFSSSTVLLLDMDNKNATHIFDLSGYNNHCKIIDATCSEVGIIGDACYFDGAEDYLDCGNSTSLNFNSSFSVGAWFRPYDWNDGVTNNGRILVNKYDYDSGIATTGFQLGRGFAPNDRNAFSIRNSSLSKTISGFNITENVNTWNFAVGVLDVNNRLAIFNNDNKNQAINSVPNSFLPSGYNLTIGKRSENSQGDYYGLIDSVFIYTTALTDDEVAYLYEYEGPLFYEQILSKGIKKLDISSCNLNDGQEYNLLIFTQEHKIEANFLK